MNAAGYFLLSATVSSSLTLTASISFVYASVSLEPPKPTKYRACHLGGVPVFKDSLAVHVFLCDESHRCKHCKTSILEFFGGKRVKFVLIGWLKAKWIKSDISSNEFTVWNLSVQLSRTFKFGERKKTSNSNPEAWVECLELFNSSS
mmetsp:Transcript_35899/g.55218  ORF Transcript_35899/g.55218 Transcript_35899/m.55218 type:complete len:147 (+) Transcript_35899:45-485(+)